MICPDCGCQEGLTEETTAGYYEPVSNPDREMTWNLIPSGLVTRSKRLSGNRFHTAGLIRDLFHLRGGDNPWPILTTMSTSTAVPRKWSNPAIGWSDR